MHTSHYIRINMQKGQEFGIMAELLVYRPISYIMVIVKVDTKSRSN